MSGEHEDVDIEENVMREMRSEVIPSLEERVIELEKRVAILEGRLDDEESYQREQRERSP